MVLGYALLKLRILSYKQNLLAANAKSCLKLLFGTLLATETRKYFILV